MAKVLVSLVGEQPIPNLLPLRYELPETAVLVHSGRTEAQAQRIASLAPADCSVVYLPVEPYNIEACRGALLDFIQQRGWKDAELVFNLTGGTKSMVLAAFEVAKETRSDFLYLQTEGRKSRIYRYRFDSRGSVALVEDRILPGLIDIDTYIRAHVGSYQRSGPAKGSGGKFERAVAGVLSSWVDEVWVGVRLGEGSLRGALEVDLVVRCENQVGVIQAKTGNISKDGIDQLNTAAGSEFLGTYTRKFLVCTHPWDHTRSNLAALAQARNIVVIPVPSYELSGAINPDEAGTLGATVRRELMAES